MRLYWFLLIFVKSTRLTYYFFNLHIFQNVCSKKWKYVWFLKSTSIWYFEAQENAPEEFRHLPHDLEERNILVKCTVNIPKEETTTFKISFGFFNSVFVSTKLLRSGQKLNMSDYYVWRVVSEKNSKNPTREKSQNLCHCVIFILYFILSSSVNWL